MIGDACLTVRITGAVSMRSTPGSAPTLSVRNSYSSSCERQTAQAARLAGPVVAIAYATSGNFASSPPTDASCDGGTDSHIHTVERKPKAGMSSSRSK
jgi:hypothetical protein